MAVSVVVQGYQELQAAAQKLVAAAQPSGALGKAVQLATLQSQQGVKGRAHVQTGTYQGSVILDYADLLGHVFIAPNANPVSGSLASVYGPIEEARGGEHAAWATTMQQDAPGVMVQAAQIILASLP
jgi:hypothetical protein